MSRLAITKIILLVLGTSLFLTACGGGGNDSSPSAEPPPPTTFTVSGSFTATSGSFIDGDVNDPNAPYTSNDTAAQAQTINSPAMVGGFASAQNTNILGDRFAYSTDPNDYYRCTLNKDQAITLTISDYDPFNQTAIDLDLYLYAADNTTPVASSITSSAQETVTVPANGNYLIRVNSVNGYTNYILTVGQRPASGTTPSVSLFQDFVPGQVLVQFKDNTLPVAAMLSKTTDNAQLETKAKSLGLTGLAGGVGRSMLMSMGDSAQHQKIFNSLGITTGQEIANELARTSPQLLEKYNTIRLLKALRARADVATADLNYIYQANKTPNDQYYSYQWHYPLINLPQAWDITTGSSNVRVAVIDTGVLVNHPDLTGKLTNTGFDFISSLSMSNDNDGIDPDPDDPGDDSTPSGSSSFHGTHVAGTIAAQTNNNDGVAGVSWDTKIIPLRALGKGGGSSYDIQQALLYAAGLKNDSGIILNANKRAHIINLSLGGSGYSQLDQDTYTKVRNQGIIVIAAAGNDNTSIPSYPASYSGVISVSAVDMNKTKAPYSNYGPYVDVAAPGGDASVDRNGDSLPDGVISTAGDDSSGSIQFVYKSYQGTSMAAPHMTGVVALMKAVYPDLTPSQLDTELQNGSITTDNGTAGRDDFYGYGLIDALKAVQRAQALAGGAPTPATLKIEPGTLNFGDSTTTLNITTSNGGTGALSISDVTSSSPSWLTVTETSVDDNKLGTYTASVDRTALEDGTYNATITFTTNIGTTNVPVTVQKGAAGSNANAGYHYIILYDPATNATAPPPGTLSFNNGVYNFTFSDVAAGTYYLIAGTDSDNDTYICDAGEACGGYPMINALAALTISGNVANLNFTTSFNFSIRTAGNGNDVLPPLSYKRTTGKRVK